VSARRAVFLLESIADLQQRLRALGSDLIVTSCAPDEAITALCQQQPLISMVHLATEVTSEEERCERKVQKALTKLHEGSVAAGGSRDSPPSLVRHWDHTLYHLDDLPRGTTPDAMPLTFSPWRNKLEAGGEVRAPLPTPKILPPLPPAVVPSGGGGTSTGGAEKTMEEVLMQLGYSAEESNEKSRNQDSRAALHFQGGETAASARLQGWMFDRDCLKDYFETRNGMLGPDYSTKFAPWLALGCMSPRTIYAEVKRYETSKGIANKSTYWVVFELIWRDFFRFVGVKIGDKLFAPYGPVPPRQDAGHQGWRDPRGSSDLEAAQALEAWKEGRTGVPLVDANMRELAATGFMSNRGRQNVASFLVHDLNLDWRAGADWFESVLLDYDVCSNWGNWVALAGLTGGRVNRFNMLKQTKDYDPSGAYLHHWIPELAKVPAPQVFDPSKISNAQKAAAGLVLAPWGSTTPAADRSAAAAAGVAPNHYPMPLPRPGSAEAFFGKGGMGGGGSTSDCKKKGGGVGRGYKIPKSDRGGGGGGRGGGAASGKDSEKSKGRRRVQSNYLTDEY
jgi:deoxyribodipyrimidine photo-lyase